MVCQEGDAQLKVQGIKLLKLANTGALREALRERVKPFIFPDGTDCQQLFEMPSDGVGLTAFRPQSVVPGGVNKAMRNQVVQCSGLFADHRQNGRFPLVYFAGKSL